MTDPDERYVFRLFVAGEETPLSRRTIASLKRLCESLPGARFEVCDVRADAAAALRHQVLAIPTVDRVEPEPPVRVVGDLSSREQLRDALGIEWPGPDGASP